MNELDIKGPGEHEVGRVGGDEDGRGNISHGELRVDPGSRVDNVARHAGHVGEEGGAGEDNGIIADEAGQTEEEGVEIEEEFMASVASPLKHLEGQIPDESGSVN